MKNQVLPLIKGLKKPINKNNISEDSAEVIAFVVDGNLDPLKALGNITYLKKCLDTISKGILEEVLSVVELHGKTANVFGITIEQFEAGVKYDYSNTKIWQEVKDEEKKVVERRKDIEGRLKALKKKSIEVDTDTGETLECYPPSRVSTTTVKVTIPFK